MDPNGYYLYIEAIKMFQFDKEQTKSNMGCIHTYSCISNMSSFVHFRGEN
jgi:hypothetical protein